MGNGAGRFSLRMTKQERDDCNSSLSRSRRDGAARTVHCGTVPYKCGSVDAEFGISIRVFSPKDKRKKKKKSKKKREKRERKKEKEKENERCQSESISIKAPSNENKEFWNLDRARRIASEEFSKRRNNLPQNRLSGLLCLYGIQ